MFCAEGSIEYIQETKQQTNQSKLKILTDIVDIPAFHLKYEEVGEGFLKSDTIETLQINLLLS